MNALRTLAVLACAVLAGCATTRTSLLLRPAQQAEAAGNDALAAERYAALLATPTTDSDTRFRAQVALARLYVERLNRAQDGLALYEQALAERPHHPDAAEVAWRLGKTAFDLGDFAKARLAFLRLVLDMSGSPFDADGRWGIAATYERLNETVPAQDAYAAFIARHPNDPRRTEAETRLEALRRGETLQPVAPTTAPVVKAPEPDRNPPPIPIPRNNDDARRLDDAPERRTIGPPTRPNARAELASWTPSPVFGYNPRELLVGDGSNVFGGEEVQETLRGDGALLDDALLHLGTLFFQMQDYRRAGACLEKVIQLGVEESEAAVNLTVCYLKENAVRDARIAVRNAFRLDPSCLSRMVDYADTLAENGDRSSAKNALTILIGLDASRDEAIRARLKALDGQE